MRPCAECKTPVAGKLKRGLCGRCYHRAWRRGFGPPAAKPPRKPRHGTWNDYTRHGCRCPDCAAGAMANKNSTLRRNQQKVADGTWVGKHGTSYSALKLYCKCEICLPVYQENNRKQWRKRMLKGEGKTTTIGRWEETEEGGYGVTVVHWPHSQLQECPECGQELPIAS